MHIKNLKTQNHATTTNKKNTDSLGMDLEGLPHYHAPYVLLTQAQPVQGLSIFPVFFTAEFCRPSQHLWAQ